MHAFGIVAQSGAALRTGRHELAERALQLISTHIEVDVWPEYYDGKRGGLIGRRANFYQVWSATGFLVAREIMHNPESHALFERCTQVDLDGVHCPDIS